jgi:hypothetical protein
MCVMPGTRPALQAMSTGRSAAVVATTVWLLTGV